MTVQTDPSATGTVRTSRGLVPEIVRLWRPKQWLKNVLVAAAPGAAGVLFHAEVALDAGAAFLAFSIVASAVYCFNDAADAEADRVHPVKRHRPVAAGHVHSTTAVVCGVALMVLGNGLALLIDPALMMITVGYVAVSLSYSLWLKQLPVIELMVVASGFVLRALAGAAATGVPISQWFFIVTSFGSLLVASGKRAAEALEVSDDAAAHRRVLSSYPPEFLSLLRSVTIGVVLTSYCLWSFERQDLTDQAFPWYPISIVPFTLAVLRYALLLTMGRGSAPEDVLTEDRVLLLAAVAWSLIFGLGVLLT